MLSNTAFVTDQPVVLASFAEEKKPGSSDPFTIADGR
jgi:hypothetical protein